MKSREPTIRHVAGEQAPGGDDLSTLLGPNADGPGRYRQTPKFRTDTPVPRTEM